MIPITGEIIGEHVILKSPLLEKATALSYAWSDDPKEANLYNVEGLPCVPMKMFIK